METKIQKIRTIKDKDVAYKLSITRSTVWRMVKNVADFPKPFLISPHSTRWYEHEIDAYLVSRAQLRVNQPYSR